jgi:hypothetical protein
VEAAADLQYNIKYNKQLIDNIELKSDQKIASCHGLPRPIRSRTGGSASLASSRADGMRHNPPPGPGHQKWGKDGIRAILADPQCPAA